MHVRLTDDAKNDLYQLKTYLEPRSRQGLNRILTAIFTTMGQLETFPHLGRFGIVGDTRELSVPRTQFRLIYQINEPYYVDVLRILHGRLKYPLED